MPPDTLSNKALWEYYTSARADDFRKSGSPPRFAAVASRDFLYDLVLCWIWRYDARQTQFKSPMADAVAKEMLIARIRSCNTLYSTLPDLPPEQYAFLEMVGSVFTAPDEPRRHFRGLDVNRLEDIPSYGPSFISLWEDAQKQGLSPEQTAEHIWKWGYFRPPAYDRERERRAKKQPLIDRRVSKRLAEVMVWRQTGDVYIPWNADVQGHRWQVRLNDFPDDYMYSLLIDGGLLGDFHEWPQAWDRGEPKPAYEEKKVAVAVRSLPAVDAGTLISRYQGGEYEAVWRDLVALGPDVHKDPYKSAAKAVAQETMRRAAHNVGLLVDRLKQLNYVFDNEPQYVARPCSKEERKLLGQCERRRFWIPLSMRAFLEEVGMVVLLGTHPALNPVNDQREPLFVTDPLEFTSMYNLADAFGEWLEAAPDEREPVSWMVSADSQTKMDMLKGEQAEDFYTVQLPNAAADVELEGEDHNITFVDYLRLSFRWGGFPGWEKYESRPETELAFLRAGLLPL